MSGEVPEEWKEASFASLADYANGRAFKPEDWGNTGLPIVRIAQITNPGSETNCYDGTVDDRHLIDDGDLIFSWSATLAVVRWSGGPAVLNQHLFKVTPAKGVDRDWLQYRLDASIPDLSDEAHGTTMKHIRKGTLTSKVTRVPPLDEQRRIAEVLRSVDDAVASAKAALEAADNCLGLLAEHLLVSEMETSGTPHSLGELLRSVEAGVSVNSEGRPAMEGELGILKTSCVSAGRFDPGEHKAVLRGERNRVRVPVTGNSIVVSRMNTLGLVGANAFVAQDHDNLFLPDRLWLIKTNEAVQCRWLAYYMKTARFRGQIEDIASGTSGSMKNISKGRFAQLPISISDISTQDAAVEVLASVEASREHAASALEANIRVRTSLCDDLLSGRVRVPV
jgi:restriction endonuclease S subunit